MVPGQTRAKFQLVHPCPADHILFAPSIQTRTIAREQEVSESKRGSRCRGMAECRMETKEVELQAMATRNMADINSSL